ncbi:GTPase ObgE [Canibacter sp. lx-72]|uniref:GTPase ObgE n=1 Tax=Canibacter zhuwentaonis TaxID=2837491 RepID=UPI001BDD39A5|nr:GTPase ObgE [Canibacter zhuwentaonis]MBT1017715.1 GTPase ObgE [Canibacter zhuwentaonis]
MVAFVDRVQVFLAAGSGGNGCVSVKREKFRPLAGSDGGNGGDGGNITLVADPQITTLLEYHRRPHLSARNGSYGAGDWRNGAHGESLTVPVPVGTVVKDASGQTLVDFTAAGQEYIAARGGSGGLGNSALASAKRKAPGFALLGTSGAEVTLTLELKSIADVALVGYPSAGKSSLIAAMSAAKPKIADYPFTTLHPNLGVVEHGEYRYTIADVPGLIEGASRGKGLGLDFLRHVERCSVLLHVLDCATLEVDRDPLSDLDVIRAELAAYPVAEGQTPLLERPQLVALNKIDIPDGAELAEFVTAELQARGYRVFPVSAYTREGLRELGYALGEIVAAELAARLAETAQTERTQVSVPHKKRAHESGFAIKVEGGDDNRLYRILGAKPERWVEQTDFTNDEAVGYLADRLNKIGIEEALVKAGAVAGAAVVIGTGEGVVFDWEPTLTSAAEAQVGARGTDNRFDQADRRTNKERRKEYHEWMDAKAAARDELERAREGGMWEQ